MLNRLFQVICGLAISSIQLFADAPAYEVIVLKSSDLSKLVEKYSSPVNIPGDELRGVSIFHSFSEPGTCTFKLVTPQDRINVWVEAEFVPSPKPVKLRFEFSYAPITGSVPPIDLRGELIQVDPTTEPYPPQPTTGKARKQFHVINSPFFINSGWQTEKYAFLRIFHNLKR